MTPDEVANAALKFVGGAALIVFAFMFACSLFFGGTEE